VDTRGAFVSGVMQRSVRNDTARTEQCYRIALAVVDSHWSRLLVCYRDIAILASLLLPALIAANQAEGIVCLNNTRQLGLAWEVMRRSIMVCWLHVEGTGFADSPDTLLNWVATSWME